VRTAAAVERVGERRECLVKRHVHVVPRGSLPHPFAHFVCPSGGIGQRLVGLELIGYGGFGRWRQMLLGMARDDPMAESAPCPGGRRSMKSDEKCKEERQP
jgi:hypothetical protein